MPTALTPYGLHHALAPVPSEAVALLEPWPGEPWRVVLACRKQKTVAAPHGSLFPETALPSRALCPGDAMAAKLGSAHMVPTLQAHRGIIG